MRLVGSTIGQAQCVECERDTLITVMPFINLLGNTCHDTFVGGIVIAQLGLKIQTLLNVDCVKRY